MKDLLTFAITFIFSIGLIGCFESGMPANKPAANANHCRHLLQHNLRLLKT